MSREHQFPIPPRTFVGMVYGSLPEPEVVDKGPYVKPRVVPKPRQESPEKSRFNLGQLNGHDLVIVAILKKSCEKGMTEDEIICCLGGRLVGRRIDPNFVKQRLHRLSDIGGCVQKIDPEKGCICWGLTEDAQTLAQELQMMPGGTVIVSNKGTRRLRR